MIAKIELTKKVLTFDPDKKVSRKNLRKSSNSENSYSDNSVKKRKRVYKSKKDSTVCQPENISEDEAIVSTNYEDNLFNEIERILIEIINNHINYDLKKNEADIAKFEKHVNDY